MAEASNRFTQLGFVKTFLLPALLIFLVPVLAVLFFWHAQSRYDAEAQQGMLAAIEADRTLTPEEKAERRAFVKATPLSKMLELDGENIDLDGQVKIEYAAFRWMIRIAWFCIVTGIIVFIGAALCVIASQYSQQAQYWSLAAGWNLLKFFGAAQTIAQGTLLVALSYWVTALWLNVYFPKLIFIAGAVALCAMGAVIYAIFRRPEIKSEIAGKVIDTDSNPMLWNALNAICEQVGTEPPDQVVAGIDDNFFVTEMPVTVDGKEYKGRTLFVSLSLLKQMSGGEAAAVLAHEMAHFSGNDTFFSKRTAPLLARFDNYLHALAEGGVTLPIYYFMCCFRALFELTLQKHSRGREFRADQIAADVTSPEDFAGGLLRILAYANVRGKSQEKLCGNEEALATADISNQIESGFKAYAREFASSKENNIGEMRTAHPFDSHPPTAERFSALGLSWDEPKVRSLCANPGDGKWFLLFEDAEGMERAQWDAFEEQFRKIHEQSLPYRFLPETDAEREVVARAFPQVTIEGKAGSATMDHEQVMYTKWKAPLKFAEITQCSMNENVLTIQYMKEKKGHETIPTNTFGGRQQEFLDLFSNYYGRCQTAKAYQEHKRQQALEAEQEKA